jgi:hypothetical protein
MHEEQRLDHDPAAISVQAGAALADNLRGLWMNLAAYR